MWTVHIVHISFSQNRIINSRFSQLAVHFKKKNKEKSSFDHV